MTQFSSAELTSYRRTIWKPTQWWTATWSEHRTVVHTFLEVNWMAQEGDNGAMT